MRRTVLGAFLVFAASTAVLAETTEFYPLKKDTKWVYKVGETTIEVKVAEAGKDDAKLDTLVNGKVVASETVAVKADGVYRTKINATEIKPAVKILDLKDGKAVAKGTKWDVTAKIQDQNIKGTFTVKDDKEKVKVPLGEFDALVVDGPDFEIAGSKATVKYWFVPGKGVVKLSYSIGGNESVLELKEFAEGK
jgi:hypothetical protein